MRCLLLAAAMLLAVPSAPGADEAAPAVPSAIAWASDYGRALEQARALDRPVMVYFWADS